MAKKQQKKMTYLEFAQLLVNLLDEGDILEFISEDISEAFIEKADDLLFREQSKAEAAKSKPKKASKSKVSEATKAIAEAIKPYIGEDFLTAEELGELAGLELDGKMCWTAIAYLMKQGMDIEKGRKVASYINKEGLTQQSMRTAYRLEIDEAEEVDEADEE